jgi:hypothetical protein
VYRFYILIACVCVGSLFAVEPDAYEGDDTLGTATAVQSGVLQSRTIHAAGDIDFIAVTLTERSTVTAEIVDHDSGLVIEGGIFRNDAPANILHYFSSIFRAAINLEPGEYHIAIKQPSSREMADNRGSYRILVDIVPIGSGGDQYERDDTWDLAERIAFGDTQQRTLHLNDRDYIGFSTTFRQEFVVSIDNP